MADTTISVRVDERLHQRMRELDHINWSAIMRKAIEKYVENSQKQDSFNEEKARKAARDIDRIRRSGIFNSGKTGTEIIREWRDKRRF